MATTTRTVRSFCRVCTSVCGILVDVHDDEVVRVRGDQDHPLSRGYTCAKGRALPQMHHHPDRLERPMVRIDGELTATTWDYCLDDLGAKVRAIVDEHGPAAVGVFFGSGNGMDAAGYRMAQALHAAIGTPAKFSPLTIDGTAKVLISDLVGGAVALSGRPDHERAELVIVIGSNPVVSHGHSVAIPDPVSTLRELAGRAEVWVIDPRRTESARLATHHLAPRPGTDYAVLAFLVRELLRDGADQVVLAERTQDVDRLADAVEPFTRAHAARIADVDPEALDRLLASVRRVGRVAIDTGTGVTMAKSANVTQWLAWAVMILTDSMNRPGGYWFHPGFGHQLEAFELPVSPPGGSFGPGPASRPDMHAFLGEWPCGVLADEIRAGNIRAVLNFGGHLLTAFPNADVLEPALRNVDVLATTEIIATDTTAISTHVLPTKDQLERADVTLWDFLSPRVAAQHTSAVIDAVGDRRSSWWVIAEIGRRLGHDLAPDDAGDDAMLARIGRRSRCSFDDLVAAGWVEVDHDVPAPWVDRHVERLGGWRLAPQLLVDQLARLTTSDALVLVPRRQVRHLNSQFAYLDEPASVVVHPDDAAAAHVIDGGRVVVRSAHGAITGIAKVDDGIRRGAVSVPHGHQDVNVNRLTSKDDLDPITGMATYCAIPVTLEPVEGTPGGMTATGNTVFSPAGGSA
jgi:anaerobic selenocysteine-containing dehydrogenase